MKITRNSMLFLDVDGGEGGGAGAGDGQQQQQQQDAGGAGSQQQQTQQTQQQQWSWVKEDGTLAENWGDHLPEDMKAEMSRIASFVEKHGASLPKILKAATHAQSLASKKLGRPDDTWTPEMVAEYRKAHGIPEAPDAYKLKPEQLGEGQWWSDELMAPLAKIAHEEGLSQKAVERIVSQYLGIDKARQQAALQAVMERDKQTEQELRKEWGDKADERLARAEMAAAALGVETDVSKNPIANHPEFIRLLDKAAAAMGEDTLRNANVQVTSTPDKQRAMDIMEGRDSLSAAYLGKEGPERQEFAANLVRELLKKSGLG